MEINSLYTCIEKFKKYEKENSFQEPISKQAMALFVDMLRMAIDGIEKGEDISDGFKYRVRPLGEMAYLFKYADELINHGRYEFIPDEDGKSRVCVELFKKIKIDSDANAIDIYATRHFYGLIMAKSGGLKNKTPSVHQLLAA